MFFRFVLVCFAMAFCEQPSKNCKVVHMRESDVGIPSQALVDFARQPTLEETKFNKVSYKFLHLYF